MNHQYLGQRALLSYLKAPFFLSFLFFNTRRHVYKYECIFAFYLDGGKTTPLRGILSAVADRYESFYKYTCSRHQNVTSGLLLSRERRRRQRTKKKKERQMRPTECHCDDVVERSQRGVWLITNYQFILLLLLLSCCLLFVSSLCSSWIVLPLLCVCVCVFVWCLKQGAE